MSGEGLLATSGSVMQRAALSAGFVTVLLLIIHFEFSE